MNFLENSNSIMTIISLLPAIICTLLVMLLKKNHNVLSAICHFIKKTVNDYTKTK